jgi:uncharacterized membrane protein
MTIEGSIVGCLRSPPTREFALWLVIAGVLAAGIGYSWNPTPFAQTLAAIFIACALVHASFFYAWRPALMLFAICVIITFVIENIGTATGFPFGHYHFEVGAGLPHVGSIPIIVGPLWFGTGYFSWLVAATLLDGADRRLDRRFNFIALPIMAAFVMTQWDVVMEPPEATIARAWIWHDGGADFGVPLSNYFGWLLTSWLFSRALPSICANATRDSCEASGPTAGYGWSPFYSMSAPASPTSSLGSWRSLVRSSTPRVMLGKSTMSARRRSQL